VKSHISSGRTAPTPTNDASSTAHFARKEN
jgi:hypothetical protein